MMDKWLAWGCAMLLVGLLACREEPARQVPAGPPAPSAPAAPPAPSAPAAPAAIAGLAPPPAHPASFHRGVSLGLFASAATVEARVKIYGQLLDEIAAVGATDVQLVVRWAQEDIRASELSADPEVSVQDDELLQVFAAARARGLRVFLLPIIHLRTRGQGEWRGTLEPADEAAWWRSYEVFILHYARLAQQGEVRLLAVGSELVSREREDARWRALIQRVRAVFTGELTYSANWDHFEPVPFWDALDLVGVTAYQELSSTPDPDEDALVQGWAPFIARLRGWAAREGHRYMFTEVGYPSHSEGAHHPWDYRPRGAPDPALQLRCYRSLYRVWAPDPRLDGLYIWNWFGFNDPGDRSYTPRGKPAEDVLRLWYSGAASADAPSTP